MTFTTQQMGEIIVFGQCIEALILARMYTAAEAVKADLAVYVQNIIGPG